MYLFIFLYLLTSAEAKLSKADVFQDEIEKQFVQDEYRGNFKKGELTGYEPKCINIFSWIKRGIDYDSKRKDISLYFGARDYLETTCYFVLLSGRISEYTPPVEMEAAVDAGLLSEEIYLYFIHSLAYAEVRYKYLHAQTAIKGTIDEKNAEMGKLLKGEMQEFNDLFKIENFKKLTIRTKVSEKYQKKLWSKYSMITKQ